MPVVWYVEWSLFWLFAGASLRGLFDPQRASSESL
jgi:hypothetical protein